MDIKDVLTYLGVPADKEFKSVDEFKEYFEPEFGRKSQLIKDPEFKKQVTGTAFANVGQNARKRFNEGYGLEIPNSELESKQIEDFIFDNVDKIKGSYEAKINELQTQITQPNEALKEFETKYSSLEKRLKEEKDAKKMIETEYNQFKETKQSELKNYKIDVLKQGIFSKIKFSSDVTSTEMGQMALKGYHKDMEDKYAIDFDESGEAIVVDKKKGERIPNEKVAGKYKTPQEIFEEEAIANKLVSINQHEGVKAKEKNNIFVNNGAQEQTQNFGNKVFFKAPR